MTDQLRKAAEMALEAMELHVEMYPQMDKGYMVDAREALRTALAQPEQEPVAWLHPDRKVYVIVPSKLAWFDKPIPLYTAPPSKQEPVAWVKEGKVRVGFGRIEERKYVQFDQTLPIGTKLFAAPVSKQEWVSLTDDEISRVWHKHLWESPSPHKDFARAIEAKLKELNHV